MDNTFVCVTSYLYIKKGQGIMGIKYFDLWIWDHKLKEYKSQNYTGWKDVDSLNISNNVDRCEIFIGKEE